MCLSSLELFTVLKSRATRWRPGLEEQKEEQEQGLGSISHSAVGQWLSPDHSLEAQFLEEQETVLDSDRLTNAQ